MATFNSPTDVTAGSLAKSSDLNNIDAAVAAAFALLPTNASINAGTVNYAADTGIADVYAVALPMTATSYTDGLVVIMKPLYANTGACTINVDSLGAKSIKTEANGTPAAGDIVAGVPIELRYSSTTGYFHIIKNSAAQATAAAASASAALVSQNAAAGSASAASSSASAASGSQIAAAASAAAALVSQNAAAGSASAASSSASAASGSQIAAAASAAAALVSQNAAAGSASSASTSAGTATTQALASAASAAAALVSQNAASGSAVAALASQSAAAFSATGSAASATTSANSAAVALAAANYKGEWTALSGAATIPYAVSLSGRFWMLNTNVANVATEMPGVSTKWTEIYPVLRSGINLIGTPGQMGFGVGICPPQNLPPGMVGLPGYDQLGHDNYGNYQFSDGSVMIWVPKFYYRVAHASNPTYATYGANSVDIKGTDTYATTALANADGYALHRAFIDGGVEKLGFFRDKYKWSKVANGTGYTAASIKNGLPLSSGATHNPFADCTGGANYNYSAIDLAHRRDGSNGDPNASSIFFASSIFMRGAIAMLSMAHGQAATSTANCAWYLTNKNYPKGCNNNALSDTDDTTVKWESDGYETAAGVYACGKTGSAGYGGGAGNVFAKSTHNGQNCGSADDNGLMYEVATGFTCLAATKAIEGITQANPCVITITGHGLENGDVMQIGTAITQADWDGLNSKVWPITKLTDDTFSVAFDASAIATAYDAGTDPGTCVLGKFYVAKEATAMKDFTQDNTTATGHWGATGVAAMMDRIVMPWGDGDALVQKFGDGTNQVLSEATSGVGYILAGMGFPKDANGNSPTGTNLFGLDYYYTYVRDAVFLLVSCDWYSTTAAGVWLVLFSNNRTIARVSVSARSACYHV